MGRSNASPDPAQTFQPEVQLCRELKHHAPPVREGWPRPRAQASPSVDIVNSHHEAIRIIFDQFFPLGFHASFAKHLIAPKEGANRIANTRRRARWNAFRKIGEYHPRLCPCRSATARPAPGDRMQAAGSAHGPTGGPLHVHGQWNPVLDGKLVQRHKKK